jgi:hypothetical protein
MSATEPTAPHDSVADQILATARSGVRPQDWYVWPLRRDRVRRQVLEAAGISLFGFILLVPLVLVTVPGNFERGTGEATFTVLLLGLVGTVAFGALGLLVGDALRLRRADQYLLVMTPTAYVRADPGRITHVPMDQIGYVTLKGVRSPMDTAAGSSTDRVPIGMGSMLGFGGLRQSRERRKPPSLAFLDLRSDREVVVATDDAFDDLNALKEILTMYATGA